jgi:hypothetical protein
MLGNLITRRAAALQFNSAPAAFQPIGTHFRIGRVLAACVCASGRVCLPGGHCRAGRKVGSLLPITFGRKPFGEDGRQVRQVGFGNGQDGGLMLVGQGYLALRLGHVHGVGGEAEGLDVGAVGKAPVGAESVGVDVGIEGIVRFGVV